MTSYQKIFYNSFFDSSKGHVNAYLDQLLGRFERIIPVMKYYLNTEDPIQRRGLRKEVSELVALYDVSGINNFKFYNFINEFLIELDSKTNESEIAAFGGWEHELVGSDIYEIPHMLHDESYKYYKWLGKSHTGRGAIVELGCWMGAATSCILEGLSENGINDSTVLSVFDSFRWSDDMSIFQNFDRISSAGLKDGDSFLWLFKKFCARYLDRIDINESYLYSIGDKVGELPAVVWNKGPIETLILDFSPDLAMNALIFDIFSPFFIPNVTTLVFNQYGNLGATDLRRFLRNNAARLQPTHKPASSIKAFLYLG